MSDPTPPPIRPGEPNSAPGQTPKSGLVWLLVILGVIILIVRLGLLWERHQSAAAPAAHGGHGGAGMGPTVVGMTTAYAGNIGIYVTALGVVTPLNTVSVNSRVQGQLMKVYYEEGQMVHAGDPLLDIDPGPDQAALLQAEGQLERDQAQLTNAMLDLERYQEAFASNAIPKQQFDTQTATVQQDQGTVKVDQGQLDNAKVQLAYCHITAPISGRVGLRLVDAGNIVPAGGSNLVVITQLQPINVVFNVAEDNLPAIQEQLRQGKTLAVDVFDRAQLKKLAAGTLATLDNQIDATSGTLKFKAIFTNEDDALFPNQFVNARLLVKMLEGVTLLPNTAIQRNADSAFVYLLGPDKSGTNQAVSIQTITVGTTDGNISEVQGIDPGTAVVADNFNKLTDGAKVMVRPAASNSTNSPDGINSLAAPGAHKHKKKAATE